MSQPRRPEDKGPNKTDSLGSEIIVLTGPGDHTRRPRRPPIPYTPPTPPEYRSPPPAKPDAPPPPPPKPDDPPPPPPGS